MSSKQLDVRAWIYCNLGKVISGNLEENTIVGAGLVNVTGTVLLDGVYKVKRGQPVRLAYYKNSKVSRIGRALRVISSYANPVTRTTELSVGCLLTYHKSNEPPPEVLTSEDDTETPDLTEIQQRLMLKPIYAKYVAATICSKLGISHNTIPLTNQFYKENFKIEGPYLNVLSDLLISEGYVGYINSSEKLAFIDLNKNDGSGPVLDESRIINIEPINSGDPSADRVYSIINYTGVRLDAAVQEDTGETEEEILDRNGNPSGPPVSSYYLKSSSDGGIVTKTYEYTDPISGEKIEEVLRYSDASTTETTYSKIITDTQGNSSLKPTEIITEQKGPWGVTLTEVEIEYSGYDDFTSTVVEDRTVTEPTEVIIEACGLPSYSFPPLPSYISRLSSGQIVTERTVTETKSVAATPTTPGSSVSRTNSKVSLIKTADGAAYIQKLVEQRSVKAGKYTTLEPNDAAFIVALASDLVPKNTRTEYGESLPTFEPPPSAGEEDENSTTNPSNGATWQVFEEPEIIFERETSGGINLELTPPYVSDDQVLSNGSGYYYVVRSDAPEKALNFARTQNRLRLGYRNGQSIVYPIEYTPIKPFAPLYLSFGGVIGQFRSDRTSIAFDSSGILVSTDAIFWGGVGR